MIRRLTLTAGQVAEKFGVSVPTFQKRRPALEAAGFPRKLPGMNAWSEPAVDRWFREWDAPAAPIDPVAIAEVQDARASLESEYAGAAA